MKALVCLIFTFCLVIEGSPKAPPNTELQLQNNKDKIQTTTFNLKSGLKSLIKNPFKPKTAASASSKPKEQEEKKTSKRLRPGKRRPPPKKTDEEMLLEMDINEKLSNCLEGIVNFSAALGYLVISLGTQFTRIFGVLMNAYHIATNCSMLKYAKVPNVCKYEVKKLPSDIRKKLKDIKKYRKQPDFIQFALEDLSEKFENVKLLC